MKKLKIGPNVKPLYFILVEIFILIYCLSPLKSIQFGCIVIEPYGREPRNMPYVTVKMLEGRTEEQKKALVEKVTAAVTETTGASVDKVVVFIEEMSKNHYAVAGKRLSDED
ncbi:2-hydroxymuconate tautomerase [Pseudobacillus sp. 179-B 2D1 NHS]|nr:2-hydroxymuconate tautomerase [Bacillus sp. PK3_68]